MATLEGCSRLHALSLAGVAVDTSSLQRLASKLFELQLHVHVCVQCSYMYMYMWVVWMDGASTNIS